MDNDHVPTRSDQDVCDEQPCHNCGLDETRDKSDAILAKIASAVARMQEDYNEACNDHEQGCNIDARGGVVPGASG